MDCPVEEPGPVTVVLATEALTEEGFSVEFHESACGLGVIAGVISNSSRSPSVLEEEGIVVCFLYVSPQREALTPEVTGGSGGGAHVERSLENLRCDLYADRVPADDEFIRFERSFASLQRALG